MEANKGTILLVEDNVILQDSLANLFIEKGYKIRAVDNGYQALDSVRRETFDVAVIDYHLSAMSSLTTMKAMKIIDPAVAIILTSVPYNNDPENLIKQGANTCTSTLFNDSQIISSLEKTLEAQNRIHDSNRQRRIFKRREFNLPIRYSQRYPSGLPSKEKESSVKNISAGGLLFESEEKVSPFAYMDMTLNFADLSEDNSPDIINSLAEVVWIQKVMEAEKYKIGIKFKEMQGITERDMLEKLLEI